MSINLFIVYLRTGSTTTKKRSKASSQSVTRKESGASKVLKKRKRLREPSGYNAFAKEFHSRQIEGEYEVSSIAVLL